MKTFQCILPVSHKTEFLMRLMERPNLTIYNQVKLNKNRNQLFTLNSSREVKTPK